MLYVLVFCYFILFYFFFNFAPLFYAAASHLLCARVRARRLSGHMAATLIDHACRFLSCVRVRSCPCCLLLLLLLLLLLFIILRNSWPVVGAAAAAAAAAPHSFNNYNNCLQ